MRKIVVLTFVSLDGVIQAPGHPQEDTDNDFRYGGWLAPHFDERLGAIMNQQMTMPLDLLLGRKTYDIFASYWPEHEHEWPGVNAVTKYVVSDTHTEQRWDNTVFISGDIVEHLRQLKQQEGPDLQVHGSSELLQTLFEHDLVDSLWLKTIPLALGSGKRLFGNGTIPAVFELMHSELTEKGVIVARYERAGAVETGSFTD